MSLNTSVNNVTPSNSSANLLASVCPSMCTHFSSFCPMSYDRCVRSCQFDLNEIDQPTLKALQSTTTVADCQSMCQDTSCKARVPLCQKLCTSKK